MVNGRVSKARSNIMLTANVMKKTLGLPLTPEEKRLEEEHGARSPLPANDAASKNARIIE